MTSPVVAKKPNAPSEGILKLLSPDGYYTYLGIEKPKPTESDPNPGVVDEEQIKKNYRKLSLLHHPDRKNGDSDTFRVLNRAQTVLTNPKLRQQYDLLGLDLDDDEEDHAHGDDGDDGEEGTSSSSTADSVMSQIASLTLATIFQAIVRTGEFLRCVALHCSIFVRPLFFCLPCGNSYFHRNTLTFFLYKFNQFNSIKSHDGPRVGNFGAIPSYTISRACLYGIRCLSGAHCCKSNQGHS